MPPQGTGIPPVEGNAAIESALNELRLRLLDLTGSNRLINFKHTPGKALQFVHTSIDAAFRRLTADPSKAVTVAALSEPDPVEWTLRNGRLVKPEPRDHAARVGIDPSYTLMPLDARALYADTSGSQAHTLFYAEDLGKHCRKLEREAKLAIEETGANMLYLVMGFLEFQETPDSDKVYLAPLLCVPVMMTRSEQGPYSTFHVHYTGEEFAENLSLREKIKRDFGLNLPEYDVDAEPSIEAYFDQVTDAIATLPTWRVRRMMTLTLLSFANMLLVRDLDPESWPSVKGTSSLLAHPLIRQVFQGSVIPGDAQYASEYAIDDHPLRDLPLIYDADSSQHSVLIDVLEGKNRVVEGPPGTGKSQTITNLIAAALHQGKTVLFVAEKLAALEVVKSRLTQAGLDPYVLELHSNKTNKKRVLDDLGARIGLRTPQRSDVPDLLEQQELKRSELKTYAELMKSTASNRLDLTLHQVMWRAERHRMRCGEAAGAVEGLTYPPASRTSAAEFAAQCDRLRYLAQHLQAIGTYGPSHPLWGFFPTEFNPQDDLAVQSTFLEFADKFDVFSEASARATEWLAGADLALSASQVGQLTSTLVDLAPASANLVDFSLLPALFTALDCEGQKAHAVLLDMRHRREELALLDAQCQQHLIRVPAALAADGAIASRALRELQALGLTSHTQGRLKATRESLNQAVELASQALESLRAAASIVGLPFNGSSADVHRVRTLALCLASIPQRWMDLRHEGLRARGTAAVLRNAQAKLQEILLQRDHIEATMYTDMLPSDEDLKRSVLTLREGDAWYRVFQSPWRSAVQLHKHIDRARDKKSGAIRLAELEALRNHQAARLAWLANPALKAAAGTHFSGLDTPLEALVLCASWAEQTAVALETAEIPRHVMDPVLMDRGTLARFMSHIPDVTAATAVLTDHNAAIRALLPRASSGVLQDLDNDRWATRIQCTRHAVQHVTTVEGLMDGTVGALSSAEAGLQALIAHPRLALQTAELEHHAPGQALLGMRFQGRLTPLEPAFAAHAYGLKVRKAGLPASIEQLLAGTECVTNHAQLTSLFAAMGRGWADALEFAKGLTRYGLFEPATWMNPVGKSTAVYAQALSRRTRLAADNTTHLLAWAQYAAARKEVMRLGLQDFATRLETGTVPTDSLRHAFIYRFYASIVQSAFETSPLLRQFSGLRHASIRQDFAELDRKIVRLRGRQVAHECERLSRPPAGNIGVRVGEKTEMELIRHLLTQQRPRVPVRKMLERAGRAMQQLKPCFMMGPQAVAQFLKPGHLHFDIVVMDEASQLRPEEALGAIARGTQMVVVGDPKQLPPTSFFSRMASTDGDGESMQTVTSDAESILEVCTSHFQPVRSLRWHYRSRHESLIAFSNHYFYSNRLVVFPSPHPKGSSLGVRYQYVADGVYDSQMNVVEAGRVVDAAVDHILHRSEDSLGIVTLNTKQKDLIAEMLEARLRSLPQATEFQQRWEALGMGLFVKNLENVQGDERDCIMISTTFGKPKGANVVRQNFGPISREGGWRRLNVLFTRARKSVAVYSSMRPEDIVLDAKTPDGTRALRNYLEYARTGVLPIEVDTGLPPDSDFEVAVLEVLKLKGYDAVPQLGVAGFRIDIAVKHRLGGSGYLAAIECDGASYHSGVSVRDRDRIRQEILESLGWKGRIWRIWSTDWFRNPGMETQRLMQFLEALSNQPLPQEEQAIVPSQMSGSVEIPVAVAVSVEQQSAAVALLEDENEDLEVKIGDQVTYASLEGPAQAVSIRLTATQTNPDRGLVAESTPLGSILIGATVGDTVVLRVLGESAKSFLIQAIKRNTQVTPE